MKKALCTVLAVLIFLLNVTFVFAFADNKNNEDKRSKNFTDVRLLLAEENKIININIDEYVAGVLVAEMYSDAPFEALKAMAVAARTYTLYMAEINKNKDYDISTDAFLYQAYQERTDSNKSSYEIMKNAVFATKDEVIAYNNELILALYHASSVDKTEKCENVFVQDLPYLVSVETPFENKETAYSQNKTISFEELNNTLKRNNLPVLSNVNFEVRCVYNENGRCASLVFLDDKKGVFISGKEARKIFNLRSTTFDVKFSENHLEFVSYGYGHGVGLSQNGACILAIEGKNYVEILNLYYDGCKVKKTIYK